MLQPMNLKWTCTLALLIILLIVGSLPVLAESNQDSAVVNQAVAVATELFKSTNPYDQISGAGTLTDIGDGDALKVLISYAKSEDFVYQRSAIDTLTHVQHPRGLDAVYRIAANTPQALHFLTQSLATNPREEMGEFLVGVLASDKPLIQQYALQALVHIPEVDVIEPTKALVANESTRRSTRAYAYYLLASRGLGAEIEDELMALIKHGDLDAKEVAAVALAFVPGDSARETIKQLKRSEDARVQLAALATDASFGNKESLQEFSRIITHGKNMNAEVAASAVRRLPDDLLKEVTDEVIKENIRPNPAARLLESWRNVGRVPKSVYEWGLSHSNEDIVTQTLWLVGQRQERDMLQKIAPFLNHATPMVRGMAAWAAVHIAPELYTAPAI
ncbi:MAG: hypothetical protein AAF387_07635 [Pseudomonadota bacterium]